tara:strand:+ start:720 stop:941 length:222 start_codon:yes stop_codon:yes gene_type:complete
MNITNNNMKNFKYRGFIPAVTKYVKSKPVVEVIAELVAFGFLLPLALSGILFLIIGMITGNVDVSNASFGIYG